MHDNLSFKSEKIKLERNKSLEGLTLFKSRGTAEYYAEPENVRGLRDALLIAKELGLRITVIGSGTHVILPDHGIDGLLISTKNLKGITIKGSLITCMAGESLNNVINSAIEHNLMGLEEFGGIPGTIAAAMRINARAQGKHISSYLSGREREQLRPESGKRSSQSSCSSHHARISLATSSRTGRITRPQN